MIDLLFGAQFEEHFVSLVVVNVASDRVVLEIFCLQARFTFQITTIYLNDIQDVLHDYNKREGDSTRKN